MLDKMETNQIKSNYKLLNLYQVMRGRTIPVETMRKMALEKIVEKGLTKVGEEVIRQRSYKLDIFA